MYLTSVESIVKAIGSMPDTSDMTNAVEDALDAATDELETIIRSDFALQNRQDDFFVNYDLLLRDETVLTFKLAQGLVTATPTISIVAARSVSDLNTAGAFLDITSGVDVDYEKGVISFSRDLEVVNNSTVRTAITGTYGRTVYFRVSYTAGLSTDDHIVYKDVPKWLARMASTKVRIILDSHPYFRQNLSTSNVKLLEDQFTHLSARHCRYFPSAKSPQTSRLLA
jgi:hypothetical protein